MRVFKNKWFDRWARTEDISDSALYNTAAEVIAGRYDADLGGYLFKKRLARTGSGKSGGYRTILSLAAESFLSANDRQVDELLTSGSIWEVQHYE